MQPISRVQVGLPASGGSAPENDAALLFIVGWVGGDSGRHSPGRLCRPPAAQDPARAPAREAHLSGKVRPRSDIRARRAGNRVPPGALPPLPRPSTFCRQRGAPGRCLQAPGPRSEILSPKSETNPRQQWGNARPTSHWGVWSIRPLGFRACIAFRVSGFGFVPDEDGDASTIRPLQRPAVGSP